MKNPNCDNDKCRAENGEIRVLPLGSSNHHGNLLLCRACYEFEMQYRRERNKQGVFINFDLPKWEDLKVYETN